MVSSFYMMNLTETKKKTYFEEYYNKLLYAGSHSNRVKHFNYLCRICLKIGSISLFTNSSVADTVAELIGVDISETDKYPKQLCVICHDFIKAFMLFREVAKRSENFLRQQSLDSESPEETLDTNVQDDDHFVDPLERDSIETPKHKALTKESAKVTCKVCSKQVSRKYYKNHMSLHDPNAKKYVCETCGKTFKLQCTYYTHSMIHQNDFPHKCDLCPYKAKYSSLLKYHMRTHNRDYRYICSECPKRFLFKGNFNRHMLRHKEPNHKCDRCKRAFFTPHRLQQHFESEHLGIKNHICNLCGKAFGRRHGLRKHMLGVHKKEKVAYRRMPTYMEAELITK